jgi:hypothetical protein
MRTLLNFVHFHFFVECSSWPLVLVMFSLFCPLPCLRGVLEFVPSVSNVLIMRPFLTLAANSSTPRRHGSGQIMRTLLTLVTKSSIPRRHGSGQNNENITKLFFPLPYLREVLEFVPSVSNVLIILFTSMSSWSARVDP